MPEWNDDDDPVDDVVTMMEGGSRAGTHRRRRSRSEEGPDVNRLVELQNLKIVDAIGTPDKVPTPSRGNICGEASGQQLRRRRR